MNIWSQEVNKQMKQVETDSNSHTTVPAWWLIEFKKKKKKYPSDTFVPNLKFTLGSSRPLQPSDDDTVSLHSQVSETARADALSLLSKMDSCKGYRK